MLLPNLLPHSHRQTAVKQSSKALVLHKGRTKAVLLCMRLEKVRMGVVLMGWVLMGAVLRVLLNSRLLTVRQMMAELLTLPPWLNKQTSGKPCTLMLENKRKGKKRQEAK